MTEANAPRIVAIDVVRGLAVAGMIFVTSPGDWNRGYWPLQHAAWHGWTLTDMIFPLFLFSVGLALGVSFPRSIDAPGARAALWLRVARRAIALVLLGLFLNWLHVAGIWAGVPHGASDPYPAFRWPGVLQRIAFCYVLGVALILATALKDSEGRTAINSRAILIVIGLTLVTYWALLSFVPVPGYGAGNLDMVGSLPAWLDRQIFGVAHLWPLGSERWGGPVSYDPEGLLSSIAAATNLLFGVLAAREPREAPNGALTRIAAVGAVLFVLGLALDPLFPINKRLWTSSFALLSSGFCAVIFVGTSLLLRNSVADRLSAPLKILGGNAILAFTISIVIGSFWGALIATADGPISAQKWLDNVALSVISDEYLASYAVALTMVTLITLMIWPLHRRAIHFRL